MLLGRTASWGLGRNHTPLPRPISPGPPPTLQGKTLADLLVTGQRESARLGQGPSLTWPQFAQKHMGIIMRPLRIVVKEACI